MSDTKTHLSVPPTEPAAAVVAYRDVEGDVWNVVPGGVSLPGAPLVSSLEKVVHLFGPLVALTADEARAPERTLCAACGAPVSDGPVSGDGEPWCSDCYAETDSSSRVVLTDDECRAILSTVEAAARDAGSVMPIRGAMWSPIFRAVENVIAERMAQQRTTTEGGTTS